MSMVCEASHGTVTDAAPCHSCTTTAGPSTFRTATDDSRLGVGAELTTVDVVVWLPQPTRQASIAVPTTEPHLTRPEPQPRVMIKSVPAIAHHKAAVLGIHKDELKRRA